ncbi:MAG TPA: hypothetical protein VIQ30_22655 [Pseudonocardia sp.]
MSTTAELAEFWVHTVTVEPYMGVGGSGPIYGPPTDVACFVEHTRRVVRSGDAREVVSEAQVFTSPDRAALFPPDSRVALDDGRPATVIVAAVHTSGALDLPDHLAVATT